MRLRFHGLLLFLLLPLATWLLFAEPVHALGALACGVALLIALRFAALAHLKRNVLLRCAWSGSEIAPGCGYRVTSAGAEHMLNFETDQKREAAARLFTFTQKFAWPLRIAVAGPALYYVAAETLRLLGVAGVPGHAVNAAVAAGLLGLAAIVTFVAHRFVEPIPHMKGPVLFPFPVQVPFLLGVQWTLLVFALAGAWGIFAAVRTFI
jgi:hypothetical protein